MRNFAGPENTNSSPQMYSWPTRKSDMYKAGKVKVKISLLQAVEAHRVARGQGSHITQTNG
jgi:hypothetical protein